MTAQRITEYDMDIHAEAIDEYARYGGLRAGMIPGPKTDLPIDAPEPAAESTWHAVRHGLLGAGALLGFLLTVAAISLLLSAWVGGVLR